MRGLLLQLALGIALIAQSSPLGPSETQGASAELHASAADSEPATLLVDVNKSVVLENADGVRRVLIGNPDMADAVAVSKNEVVVNGKIPGETTLVLWSNNGQRKIFDVHVLANHSRLDGVREQLGKELPGQDVDFQFADGFVYLRGTVSDLVGADRAVQIASTLGKVIDLLNVKVAPSEPQILLRVRFANVDRAASLELGANFFSTGAGNTVGGISTEQFSPPSADKVARGYNTQFSFADALNVLLFNPNINLGATIKALQAKQLAEILAEPNLLTLSGKPASFLSGGEFPYPTLQGGGAGVGQITIQFREFGVRLYFLPTVTPRGTIHMVVIPEVSSLDFANGLTVQGFTIPGLATRRVQTEIELGSGQSFGIGGLLDNRLTETISKVPGLGNIPLLGKMFQSKSQTKNHSELLVLVTAEIVDPIAQGSPRPDILMPKPLTDKSPSSLSGNLAVPSARTNWMRQTTPAEVLRGTEGATAGPSPNAQLPAAPLAGPSLAPNNLITPPATSQMPVNPPAANPPKI